MSRNLPESPNLEHLKKQAKVRLRRLQQRKPEAKLSEAQHAVAGEYGFASWTRLKAHVESRQEPGDSSPKTAGGPTRRGIGGGAGAPPPHLPPSEAPGGESGGVFDRYTEKARRVLFVARYRARQHGTPQLESHHLLLGVLQEDEGLVNRVLRSHVAGDRIRKAIEKEIDRGVKTGEENAGDGETILSPEWQRVLGRAASKADRLGHRRIGPGHLLLALLEDEHSPVAAVLTHVIHGRGMRTDALRDDLIHLLNIANFLNEPGHEDRAPLETPSFPARAIARGLFEHAGAAPGTGLFARYTEHTRKVIFFGRYEATQHGSPRIETEHLLLGIIRDDPAPLAQFLGGGASIESVRQEIGRRAAPGSKVPLGAPLPLSDASKQALAGAAREADRLRHRSIDTGHLVLGLAAGERSVAAAVLSDALAANGRPLETARAELVAALNAGSP